MKKAFWLFQPQLVLHRLLHGPIHRHFHRHFHRHLHGHLHGHLRGSWRTPVFLVWSLFVLAGCDRSGQRLQEKAPPNPLVQQAPKGVEAHLVTGNKQALWQSAKLDAADAAHILKGFLYTAKASYQYVKSDKTLSLQEKIRLQQTEQGAFHLTVENDRQKGYEVVWVNQTLYQKMRHRPFRVISRNVEDARRWQQRGVGRWRGIVQLFGPYLALSQAGNKQEMGRSALTYQLALLQSAQPLSQKPEEGTAWAGVVPDHTRGMAAKIPRRPLSIQGEVTVDQSTGLVLQVNVTGRYQVGEGKDKVIATLTLQAQYQPNPEPSILPPKQVVLVQHEVDAHDPFARKKPAFFQPPPGEGDNKGALPQTKPERKRKRKKQTP